jgi:hypothetical protein
VCKKDKKKFLTKSLILAPFFSFLHMLHENLFFLKRLGEHVGYEDVCAIFLKLLTVLICLKCILNKGGIYARSKKPHV